MSLSEKRTEQEQVNNYAASKKGKQGFRRFVNAAGYSYDGVKAAYKSEVGFRQLLLVYAILTPMVFVMDFSLPVKMILVFASFFSIIVELLNTGIEAAIDHSSTEYHPMAKVAKDVGSAAQFFAMGLVAILWLMALLDLWL